MIQHDFSPMALRLFRLGNTIAHTPGSDMLIERHVLTAKPDVKRASDLIRAEAPARSSGRSMTSFTQQHVGNRILVPALVA